MMTLIRGKIVILVNYNCYFLKIVRTNKKNVDKNGTDDYRTITNSKVVKFGIVYKI